MVWEMLSQLQFSLVPRPLTRRTNALGMRLNYIWMTVGNSSVIVHIYTSYLPVFLLFMEMRVLWRGYLVKNDPVRCVCAMCDPRPMCNVCVYVQCVCVCAMCNASICVMFLSQTLGWHSTENVIKITYFFVSTSKTKA